MSAGTTASQLLSRVLSKEEYAAIVRHADERNLTSDDTVLFMLAVLKLFDHMIEDFVAMIDLADTRKVAMEADFAQASQTLAGTIDTRITRLAAVMGAGNATLTQHIGGLQIAVGEIKALTEQLRIVTRDAREAFAAHEVLRGDGHGLIDVFRTATLQALNRRVPAYEKTIRDQLSAEFRRFRATVILSLLGVSAVTILIVAAVLSRL